MKRSRRHVRVGYALVSSLIPIACSLTLPDEGEFFTATGGSTSSGGQAGGGASGNANLGGQKLSGGRSGDAGAAPFAGAGSGGEAGGGAKPSSGGASAGGAETGGTGGLPSLPSAGSAGTSTGGAPVEAGAGGQGGGGTVVGPFNPTQGLLLHYGFEETSGTAVSDTTAGNNDGVVNGSVTWGATGKVGKALQLSGQQAYVSVPTAPLNTLPEVTMAIWFSQDSRVLWTRVLDFGSSQTHWMYFAPATVLANEQGARAALDVANFITAEIHMTSVLPGANEWMHVAITWSKTRYAIYVNGVFVDEDTNPVYTPAEFVALTPGGETFRGWIGRSSFTADPYLAAKVDEFRVYDHVLPAEHIAELHALVP